MDTSPRELARSVHIEIERAARSCRVGAADWRAQVERAARSAREAASRCEAAAQGAADEGERRRMTAASALFLATVGELEWGEAVSSAAAAGRIERAGLHLGGLRA